MKFQGGEKVLLKLSLIKGVIRFDNKEKHSPQYIRLYEIIDYVSPVAYRLDLPLSLSRLHLLFHVCVLKKYHGDEDFIIKWDSVLLDKDLHYEKKSVVILDAVSER